MATQNGVDNYLISFPGGICLPNVKYSRANFIAGAAGNNDIYTAPAGRRALVMFSNMVNQNGSSRTCNPAWKISGTYYNMNANSTSVPASSPLGVLMDINDGGFVLEPGETLAWNCQNLNMSVYSQIIEFDNSAPASLKTVKIIGITSGNNTVYTVPAGKKAIIFSGNGLPFGSTNNGGIWCSVGTTPLTSCTVNLVPSGGSVTTANQIYGGTFFASACANVKCQATLQSGDFVNVTSGVTDATCMAAVNVLEF